MRPNNRHFADVMNAVRRTTPLLVVLTAAINLLLLVTSIYMLQVYDRVLSSGSFDTLLWLTVIALFTIAIYGVLEQARRLMLSRTAIWIDRELTAPVLERRMESRLAGVESPAGPREVADLRTYYQSDAAISLLDAPWSAVFLVVIWSLHPALGVLALSGAIALFALAVVNDLLTRPHQEAAARAVRSANEAAIRYLDHGETIRPLGMTQAVLTAWRNRQADARGKEQRLGERTTTVLSISRGLRLGLQVGILGLGAFLVLSGEVTAGAMIASSIMLGRALAPIERLTGAWRRLLAARTARRSLRAAFSADGFVADPVALPRPSGALAVEGLYYTPPGTREPILRDITFATAPGTYLAVLGPSGSGKSSLCRLLVGAWKPTGGHVRLDGAEVFDWDPEQLGRHIGYLPQKVQLFPGTVAQNIARFGKVDSDAVIAAAQAAGVHEMILRLPEGYDTVIDDRSERVSLGQRQRIGLARALFGDPAFVVLDEPNSNLDRAGDESLQEAIASLKARGKSIVVVSHRASVLKLADVVLTLQDGKVKKFGELESLVASVPAKPAEPAKPRVQVRARAATPGTGS